MKKLKMIIVASVFLGLLDFLWLGFISKDLYSRELGDILLTNPNFAAAILFYVIYVIGIVFLVVSPAIDKHNFYAAIGYGALLGLVAYSTYDLTNLATMKGFPTIIAVIDILWGTFITTVTAGAAFIAVNKNNSEQSNV